LLFDEPTSGLDPEVARTVRGLLAERRAAGCAILLSTHNLDEAERLGDRVAVLQRRLLAIDRPAALRRRLTTNRVTIRLAADAHDYIATIQRFDPRATADGTLLSLSLPHGEDQIPEVIRALVHGGAAIVEVRQEMPDLEDVYLHLVAAGANRAAMAGAAR